MCLGERTMRNQLEAWHNFHIVKNHDGDLMVGGEIKNVTEGTNAIKKRAIIGTIIGRIRA